MRRSTLIALSVVGVVALVVAGWAWFGLRGKASTHVVAVNVPLPQLQGETLSGDTFDSSSLEGHVSVINVWATWCVPCEQELPDLANAARHYAPQGVQFLGINERDDRALAKGWQDQRFGLPYPSLFDPSGRFAGSLKFPSLPDTYVVDASGMVRWVIYGRTDQAEVSGLIDKVLAADAGVQ
jgi:cytochrome c biogenesis protein CcmG/thiol:disulfide interchange protein DsbE